MQQSTQNRGHQRALASELDDQPRLLASVLRAHMETCEFTREKVTNMRQRARDCPTYSMPTLVSLKKNIFCSFFRLFEMISFDLQYFWSNFDLFAQFCWSVLRLIKYDEN